MRKTRVSALLLAALLSLSLSLPAAAAGKLLSAQRGAPAFADTAGTPCADAVEAVYGAGLLNGYTAGSFGPEDALTPAQLVTVCARLHSRLTGETLPAPAAGEAWYDAAYRYLAAAIGYQGVYDPKAGRFLGGGDGAQTPEAQESALRANFHPTKYPAQLRMLSLLLDETLAAAGVTLPEINGISALVNVRDWDYPGSESAAVYDLCRAGVLTVEDEYGTVDLYGTVTRGDLAMVLARVLDPALRETYTVEPFDLCADVLGLEREAAVLTVDGRTITAEELAQELCLALEQNVREDPEDPDPELALTIAVTEIREDLAIDALAEAYRLNITQDTLSAAYGGIPAGYEGVSHNGWLWEFRHELLHEELYRIFYLDLCGASLPEEEALYCNTAVDAALGEALAAVRPAAEDVTLSPALESLDWDAVLERLLDSPFADL